MPDNQILLLLNGRFDSLESQISELRGSVEQTHAQTRASFEAAIGMTNSRIDKLSMLAIGGMGTALLALIGWIVSALQKHVT